MISRNVLSNARESWAKWEPTDDHPWNHRMAAHLVRRAAFGATTDQLDRFVELGFQDTLDALFDRSSEQVFDEEMKPIEQVLASSQDPQQLASWWLLRMRQTPCQLLEKATLFWHGHFATGAEKVQNARAMLAQNRMLREHALGQFEPMVQGISRDVAMLIYLDSEDNRKTRPNENYARELMELFCLGPGNYSEEDIKEIARCFTGWQVYRGSFRFNRYQHDRGEKSFLGQSGNFSGEQAVRIVLDQPAAPRFLARKLIRFFVIDDVQLDDELIGPIAEQLRETDFDMGAAIRTILESNFFYSDQAVGGKVRSPVEMAIGMLRFLDASLSMTELRGRLLTLGHLPMYPPNVKGWEGGRQWINASTYFGRANLVRDMVSSDDTTFAAGSVAESLKVTESSKPERWVGQIIDAQLAVALPDETIAQLIELASDRGTDINERVINVITAIGATPEFQLA
ncbi:MAG: DUF1800 domain-containing protein [Pirellulaceae bacterium]